MNADEELNQWLRNGEMAKHNEEPGNPILQEAVRELAARNGQRTNDPRGPGKTALPIVQNGQAVKRPSRAYKGPIYQKIVLMGERPESYNNIIRWHWRKFHKEVDRVKHLILSAIGPCDPIAQPVNLVFTVFYEKRPLDTSNLSEKLYEDGLVAAGLLVDDNRKYVHDIIKRRPQIDKERPRLEIEILSI